VWTSPIIVFPWFSGLQQGAEQKALTISGGNLGGNQCDVEVTVKGDAIVVTVPGTTFSVTYRKSPDSRCLSHQTSETGLHFALEPGPQPTIRRQLPNVTS